MTGGGEANIGAHSPKTKQTARQAADAARKKKEYAEKRRLGLTKKMNKEKDDKRVASGAKKAQNKKGNDKNSAINNAARRENGKAKETNKKTNDAYRARAKQALLAACVAFIAANAHMTRDSCPLRYALDDGHAELHRWANELWQLPILSYLSVHIPALVGVSLDTFVREMKPGGRFSRAMLYIGITMQYPFTLESFRFLTAEGGGPGKDGIWGPEHRPKNRPPVRKLDNTKYTQTEARAVGWVDGLMQQANTFHYKDIKALEDIFMRKAGHLPFGRRLWRDISKGGPQKKWWQLDTEHLGLHDPATKWTLLHKLYITINLDAFGQTQDSPPSLMLCP